QFGSDLDDATKQQLERGKRIVEILKQGQYTPVPVEKQVAILYSVINGLFDNVKVEEISKFEEKLHKYLDTNAKELLTNLSGKDGVTDELGEQLKKVVTEFKGTVEDLLIKE
ncbi:F0F1 ATP synthase subunit alpha, partial [Candidatus Falkowbacteria bacterium]|nr:F0F1 ATP synthase subunit alpha [Candidatus Falkowbacteria bacterium]